MPAMNSCSCLTLLLACVVYWQAKEISRVLKMGIPEGEDIDISLLEHVSPIEWENVILYGQYVLNPDEHSLKPTLKAMRETARLVIRQELTAGMEKLINGNPHQNCRCKSRCPKDAISRRYRAARALPQSPICNRGGPAINSAVLPTTPSRLHNEALHRNSLCLLP